MLTKVCKDSIYISIRITSILFMIENPENIPHSKSIDQYKILDPIGHGAFSVVRVAKDIRSNIYYACKIVPRSRISTTELETRFETEIRVLQQMRHPNIVQLVDLKKDKLNYYIFMEFCSCGELFQYIVNKKRVPEADAKIILFQIIDALKYCHSHNVVHRDMKPENLLFDSEGHIKITDFGLSRYVGAEGLVTTSCGSPCYASPEVLIGNPYDGSKSDMWSVGVILYAMVTGNLPWTKKNQAQLFDQIKRGEYSIPDFISPSCQSLIRSLMCTDSAKRLSAVDALRHSFFDGLKLGEIQQKETPIVSMHKLDKFFLREVSEPKFLYDEQSGKPNSARGQNFRVASRWIHLSLRTKNQKNSSKSHNSSSVIQRPILKPATAAIKQPKVQSHKSDYVSKPVRGKVISRPPTAKTSSTLC